MSRSVRKSIANETVKILDTGNYVTPSGRRVSIEAELSLAQAGTQLIRPDDFQGFVVPTTQACTEIAVVNETTFAGAKALLDQGASEVCSLNFASAKNPGGGFLGGSQAQEEALARASGLYACLLQAPKYYDFHRSGGDALYSHHMIYSPSVPVFRNDNDELLDETWKTAIITSPAVNAGALLKNSPELANQVIPVMADRIQRVLRLAATKGHRNLVLGAWGCGVFHNDPCTIAKLFADCLDGPMRGIFDKVRFSTLDRTKDLATFTAFHDCCSLGTLR